MPLPEEADVVYMARAFTGQPVPTPAFADADRWARFVSLVAIIPDHCSLWMGNLYPDFGYGKFYGPKPRSVDARFRNKARCWGAHRYAYLAHYGYLPPKKDDDGNRFVVMHECDEPLCVPVLAEDVMSHLSLGNHQDNAIERESRGRGGRRRHAVRRMRMRVDLRGPGGRSVALRDGLLAAIRAGAPPGELAREFDRISAAGDPPWRQLTFGFAEDVHRAPRC